MKKQAIQVALASVVAFGVLLPTSAAAQRAQTRAGFWFNGGLGFGSAGCDGCDGRETAPTVTLTFGGTISPKFLLGASIDGWSKEEGGASLTVATLLARLRFYPSANGGFFLTAGVGMGTVSAEVSGLGSDSETGTGVLIGLGYDIRVGRNVSLTPFWNGFATHTSNTDFNVGQLGLSVTTH
jgi:Outer membrane protein beta-barrel domain